MPESEDSSKTKPEEKPVGQSPDVPGKKTLAFDIGGSGLKASLLDENGQMITKRVRVETPQPCPPGVLIEKFKGLIAQLPPFDRVWVGFPGVVRKGGTLSCKNLGSDEWN